MAYKKEPTPGSTYTGPIQIIAAPGAVELTELPDSIDDAAEAAEIADVITAVNEVISAVNALLERIK